MLETSAISYIYGSASSDPFSQALEDPLAYLPRSSIVEYQKGCIIQCSTSLFLIIDGRVTVFRSRGTIQQPFLLDIFQAEEFFGYSILSHGGYRNQWATPLERTKLMSWTAAEMTDLVQKRPRLAVALIQLLAQRAINVGDRFKMLRTENTRRRLALSLIHFAARFGDGQTDGSVRIIPCTHKLLAQYIGSTRETVTVHMREFRQQGYLSYSRREIRLYKDALLDWLRKP
jgi:CRP/FNR family cyclic AMP-dependent transcriptional regulator